MSTVREIAQKASAATAAKDWVQAAELWQQVTAAPNCGSLAFARAARALRLVGNYDRANAVIAAGENAYPADEHVLKEKEILSRKVVNTGAGARGNVYHGNTAAGYQKRREGTVRWQRENNAVGDLLNEIADGSTVLDLPLGTGRFLPYYARKQLKVIGIDISEDMLNAARAENPDTVNSADLRVGNALAIDLPDRSVDVVVSVRFLQNIIPLGQVRVALKEFARVTRGYAIIELEIRKNSSVVLPKASEDQPIRGQLFYPEVEELLAGSGLEIAKSVSVYDNEASHYFILLCRRLS